MNWKTFYFESNNFFGNIDTPSDFQKIRNAYPEMSDAEILTKAKEATYRGHRTAEERARRRNYGMRWEHDGEPLFAFFKRHGMAVPDAKQ